MLDDNPSNVDGFINATNTHKLGDATNTSELFDGYLSDINFIDGQALDASSFGETVDGYWKAKDYAGTYGTNGFHLTFKDDVVSEGFNAVTYRGNDSANSISGIGFSPDFVWIKQRNAAENHFLTDSVRGAGLHLRSDATTAESDSSATFTSFDADGFSLTGTGSAAPQVNDNNDTYVAWAWDAGSGSTASNTDGSITSTVKANTDYGFSIVKWVGDGTSQGATVGHSLGVTPGMIIVKSTDSTAGWNVWHEDLTNATTSRLLLNDTDDEFDSVYVWGSTAPDNSAFGVGTVGTTTWTNRSSRNYIAYCFAEVAGYSSIGSYTGTGVSGKAVTGLGFQPAWLMIKRTDGGTNGWMIYDSTRDTVNDRTSRLKANASDEEDTGDAISFDSDGFTLNATGASVNGSTNTYIYMAFADTREAAFWKDVSGNNNNWTPNNLDYRDSLPDSPANNFATLNLLFTNGGATQNFKEGNLQFTADGNYALAHGTFAMRTGKWYWETYIKSWVSVPAVGISRGTNTAGNSYVGYDPNGNVKSFGYESGGIIYGASRVGTSAGSQLASGQTTYTTGDVIGCSFDADVGELKFYKNGTLIYTVSSIDEFDWMPATSAYNGGINIANFGQDSTFSGATTAGGNQDDNGIGDFKYAPPSGYLALCTANLPEPTIVDGSEHFNTVLYTGDNADRNIDVGFKSDFVWIKQRSSPDSHHRLFDSVRGDGQTLFSSLTNNEADGVDDGVDFAYADGFNIDAGANVEYYNGSGRTYASWNWKAGGTAVSNTAGTITSQVSANVDAGFSIVTWTQGSGNTSVGHGLGVRPSMIMGKTRTNGSFGWHVFHDALSNNGENQYLFLNLTNAATTSAGIWSTTDSSVFNASPGLFAANETQVAYCFHSVEGYSKMGSYTGNGSTDGSFVYTGFRPAWIMVKRAVGGNSNWDIMDAERSPHNIIDKRIYANLSNSEATADFIDFTSNGFKVRNTTASQNTNGNTYIYLAFAETPQKFANAR